MALLNQIWFTSSTKNLQQIYMVIISITDYVSNLKKVFIFRESRNMMKKSKEIFIIFIFEQNMDAEEGGLIWFDIFTYK